MSEARALNPTMLPPGGVAPVGRSREGPAGLPRCSRQAGRAVSHRWKPRPESLAHRSSPEPRRRTWAPFCRGGAPSPHCDVAQSSGSVSESAGDRCGAHFTMRDPRHGPTRARFQRSSREPETEQRSTTFARAPRLPAIEDAPARPYPRCSRTHSDTPSEANRRRPMPAAQEKITQTALPPTARSTAGRPACRPRPGCRPTTNASCDSRGSPQR
jgi:hypothetical protein